MVLSGRLELSQASRPGGEAGSPDPRLTAPVDSARLSEGTVMINGTSPCWTIRRFLSVYWPRIALLARTNGDLQTDTRW